MMIFRHCNKQWKAAYRSLQNLSRAEETFLQYLKAQPIPILQPGQSDDLTEEILYWYDSLLDTICTLTFLLLFFVVRQSQAS